MVPTAAVCVRTGLPLYGALPRMVVHPSAKRSRLTPVQIPSRLRDPYYQRRGPIPPPAISATAAYSTSASVSPGGDSVTPRWPLPPLLEQAVLDNPVHRCDRASQDGHRWTHGSAVTLAATNPDRATQVADTITDDGTRSRALAGIAGARLDVRAPTRLVAVSTT